MKSLTGAIAAGLIAAIAGFSFAKLPPPTDEQKAKAAEAKAKAAEAAKKEAESLSNVMDRVAARYKSEKGGAAAPAADKKAAVAKK